MIIVRDIKKMIPNPHPWDIAIYILNHVLLNQICILKILSGIQNFNVAFKKFWSNNGLKIKTIMITN